MFRNSFLVLFTIAVIISAISASPLSATNGYYSHAFSIISKGMAGAGVAYPLDILSAADNPANLALVSNGFEYNLSLFNPDREYKVTGAVPPAPPAGSMFLTPGTYKSSHKYFVVPAAAVKRRINSRRNIGYMMYGNGGMNTDYGNKVFGSSPTGVDLSQLFISPVFSFQIGKNSWYGISPVFAYQKFQAEGLGAFAPMSQDPANLTDKGHDTSFGVGINIGYLTKLNPKLNLGITYKSRVNMNDLNSYKGLFAEQGDFDIPPSVAVGLALKASEKITVVLDWQRIYYTKVSSISNKMDPATLGIIKLGSTNGAGFGWEDMDILKFGAEWKISPITTLRMGLSHAKEQIPSSEVLFNIVAPGVTTDHASVGLTRKLKHGRYISFALTHAFEHTVSGPNPLAGGAQNIELKMKQWEASFGYCWKY